VIIQTEFDKSVGKINIVPQDIGRVLLNLYNNAFYAVKEKAKSSLLTPERGIKTPQTQYEPIVSVKTSLNPPSGRSEAAVLVTVKDNGNGIPQNIVDKIFQPFFTTKPTGQGTGLGLSLSYDIIKAHGGEIKAETKEGEGSEFIIQLPINTN
jgi:two-component system NtrC family sensor kinase